LAVIQRRQTALEKKEGGVVVLLGVWCRWRGRRGRLGLERLHVACYGRVGWKECEIERRTFGWTYGCFEETDRPPKSDGEERQTERAREREQK
jgi:hypothetical protein